MSAQEEDQQTVTSADQSQDYSSNVSTSTKESDQTSLRPEEGWKRSVKGCILHEVFRRHLE